ncbi:permease-like cell division protein FtsX [soil metagenome]|jgi:cell division transport system permease protein
MRASFLMSGVATGLRRNVSMTVALVLSTGISLAFLGGAFLIGKEINKFKTLYEDKINVSVFLCTDFAVGQPGSKCKGKVTQAQVDSIRSELTADPLVKSYQFISEAQATARGKQLLGDKLVDEAGSNIFPPSFTLKLKDLKTGYLPTAAKYSSTTGVDGVQNQDASLKTMLNLFDSAKWGARVVAFIVGICAIIQMANTIQVAAAQRRNETGIMRLVGASRLMTQLPFIIEAIIAALAGGLIAIGLDWAGKKFILDGVFGEQVSAGVLPKLDFNDVLVAGGVGLVSGIVLSALTAWATLRLAVRL